MNKPKRVGSLSVDEAVRARNKITAESLQPFKGRIKELERQLGEALTEIARLRPLVVECSMAAFGTGVASRDDEVDRLRPERDRLRRLPLYMQHYEYPLERNAMWKVGWSDAITVMAEYVKLQTLRAERIRTQSQESGDDGKK